MGNSYYDFKNRNCLWLFSLFFIALPLDAQTTLVTELTGNPMNTAGWSIISEGGGGFVSGDEFVFTQDVTSQKAAIYYTTPYNLNQCKEWRIEFDFRIWGNGTTNFGNGDGLAFWYLENPPENFVDGGGIGIPADGRGIMVVMDTFDNATEDHQSELQILYGQGYHEINNAADMYFFNTFLPGVYVRSSAYQHMVIQWQNGLITVTIGGVEICSFMPTPHDGAENIAEGYFGFSSSTGAASDRHSIKNVFVYMDLVEVETENVEMYACDPDGDGFAEFDLTSQNDLIISNSATYDIEYFENLLELNNDINPIPNPGNYTAANNQTVYVKVQNGEDCYDISEIDLFVNSMPSVNEIPTQYYCDEDSDGMIEVNLNNLQSQLISGSLSGLDFSFYTDSGLSNEIPQTEWVDYEISTFPFSVWIVVEKEFNPGGICAIEPYEVVFDLGENLPVNGEAFTLSDEIFCADEGETLLIDLTQIQNDFTDETGVNYFYYETENQALIGGADFIPDPENYPVTDSGSVYVRLEKEGFCFNVVRIDFEFGFNPEAEPQVTLNPKCDDDMDGYVQFDLSVEAVPLLVDDITGLTFTYYLSETDAQNQTNPQSSTVTVPIGQTLSYWVVISNGSCSVISEVEMTASEGLDGLEESVEPIEICDDDFDGIYTVDLTQIESEFLNDLTGINFLYFSDPGFNIQIPDDEIHNYILDENTQIWILIFNGDCSATRSFEIHIKDEVPHNSGVFQLDGECEEESIDLTTIEIEITSETNVEFIYYLNESDAQHNFNPISDPQEFFTTETEGILYVRLEKDGYCPVIVPFEFELSPLPESPFDGNFPTLCSGETLVLNAGNDYPDQNYIWTWGNQEHTGAEITITEPGIYTLSITTENGCEREFTIEIQAPAQPVITQILIGDNYLIVEAAGSGGLLEYSLNGVFWQDSPRFDNLIPGEEYTVYVRESGCDPVSRKAVILMIPNFISPNGDGYNDTWTVRGLQNLEQCNVKIFDRYGKIFVDSTPQDWVVWSGYYMGRPVPSGDYWYIITTIDQNMAGMKYVGHISVRNRD